MARKSKKRFANGFEHVILNWKCGYRDHRDWRMENFISLKMRSVAKTITQKDWLMGKILDQGQTPHCVGYAWAGYGIVEPVVDPWDNSWGEIIYYQAKIDDGQPGQEDGTETKYGAQAFTEVGGKFEGGGYAWAHTLDDIVTWLLTKSPVITGELWTYDMFYPDPDGLVHVNFSDANIAGGHEWMINGVDTVARQLHCVNSWGESYGVKGTFKIGFDDFETLWNNGGDAVVAVEASSQPPVPPPNPGCLSKLNLKILGI